MSTQPIPTHSEPLTYEKVLELINGMSKEVKEMHRQEQIRADKRADERAEKRAEERARQYEKERKEYEQARERERKKEQDAWNKRFGEFSDRLGEFIEEMVEGKIVQKFQELDYPFTRCSRRAEFANTKHEISGEIDLLLEGGDCVLGVEVKLKLTISDIREHIVRLQKYRQYLDAEGDNRKVLAAVAGGVIPKNVREFAAKNGLFVITQSGEAFDIIPPPKGFKPKEW